MADPSTSKEVQEKTGMKELFDMKNFPHWLDMDEEIMMILMKMIGKKIQSIF